MPLDHQDAPPARRAPPDPGRRRDDFYLKVAIVVLVLLGVNLVLAWILQYYFHDKLIFEVSFRGYDPSWIPKGTRFSAALGLHYFGDFEQYAGYASSRIPPYSSAIVYPAAYGPLAILMVHALDGVFGWPTSVLVFLPVSLLFFLWGMARLLGSSLSARLLALLMLFSAGILVCLDRGNLQILVAALCVWFAVGLLEDRPVLMIVTLSCAIGIKLYVAVLLLVLLRQRRWADAGKIAGLTAALYAVGFALVGGNYFDNIKNFVKTNLGFASGPHSDFLLGCVSAAAAVYKTLFLFWGVHHFTSFLDSSPSWYPQVPGLIVGCACLAALWLARGQRELSLVIALALMQLAPASTYPYVAINTVIELALLVRLLARRVAGDRVDPEDSLVSRPILLVCVALMVIGSAPWFGMIHGNGLAATSLTQMISPYTSMLMVLVLLVGLILGRRQRPGPHHAPRRRAVGTEPPRRLDQPAPVPEIPAERS